jgi:phage/plasmid primase-like uncharacterized protein
MSASIQAAMSAAGIESPPPEIVSDGKLHRFAPVQGRQASGWYVVHDDPSGTVCFFGDWRTGIKERCDSAAATASPEEIAARDQRIREIQTRIAHEEDEFQAGAAMEAQERWDRCPPARKDHGYLKSKRIDPCGSRIDGGDLLIPMRDAFGKLWSIQEISADGHKRNQPGGRRKGCFFTIGDIGDVILIGEGFSTCATLHMATGYAAISAGEAGNLGRVARAIREKHPAATIIICGDDDWLTKVNGEAKNIGKLAAAAAAEAVGGVLALPWFGSARPQWATDFNDQAKLGGLDEVATTIKLAIVSHEERNQESQPPREPASRVEAPGGRGGAERQRPREANPPAEDQPVAGSSAERRRGSEPSAEDQLIVIQNAGRGSAYRDKSMSCDQFWSHMPTHKYIFIPTGDLWPAVSVNVRVPPIIELIGDEHVAMKATVWIDHNQPVEQMTWMPGKPKIVVDRLAVDGGWIDHLGATCLNLYRAPPPIEGDPANADRWVKHVRYVYPDNADHIIMWLAHRVQRPHEKINHAIVLGGKPGIGKDTLIAPARFAIGEWNFKDIEPKDIVSGFNGYRKAVILRVNEARDLGDIDRFKFYELTKGLAAAPPEMLRVNEKFIPEYYVPNVLGLIITSNHKADGLYIPADCRRHYVAWSNLSQEDFSDDYFPGFWEGYYAKENGLADVAAYLTALDISKFNPHAPPLKTPAFWDIVGASRVPEDAETQDAIDRLGSEDGRGGIIRPAVLLISQIAAKADEHGNSDFAVWWRDRRNSRKIPHRLEACGYAIVRNRGAKDGLWKINNKRQAVYARDDISVENALREIHHKWPNTSGIF